MQENNNLIINNKEEIRSKLNSFLNLTPEYISDVIQRSNDTLESRIETNEFYEDVFDFNYYPNHDALNTAMYRFSQDYAIAATFVDDVDDEYSDNLPRHFEKLACSIALYLSDGTKEDIIRQASRYLSAQIERDNGNPEEMRQILKDTLAKTSKDSVFEFDSSNPDEIYKHNVNTFVYYAIYDMLDHDKEFNKEFSKDVKAEMEYAIKAVSVQRSRSFEYREIGINVDRIIPELINNQMEILSSDGIILTYGTPEYHQMRMNVINTWKQAIFDKNENPRFIVPPSSIGIKPRSSKDSYEPSNFDSYDKVNEFRDKIHRRLLAKDANGMQYSVSVAESFLSTQESLSLAAEYQESFSSHIHLHQQLYVHETLFIDGEPLSSLIDKQIAILKGRRPEMYFDREHTAVVIMAQALADPNKVISTAVLSQSEDGAFKYKAIPFEKDYTVAAEASKKTHGYLRRFLHVFGWKYPEESLQKKQDAAIEAFKKNNVLQSVEEKINSKMKEELDGFATNFSSVAVITMNLFSKVKVGENIIREAMDNSLAKEILKTIVNKSHEMGITLCAKEIENKEELQFVEELGFDEIQGNIFYPPTSLSEFEKIKK